MSDYTLEQMVKAARRQKVSFGNRLHPGATDHEIATMITEVGEVLDAELPEQHLELLRITNGLGENSLSVFGTHTAPEVPNANSGISGGYVRGLVEMNLELRADAEEELHDVLLFSLDDLYYHGQDLASGEFVKMPRTFWPRVEKTFATFDELMIDALKTAIDPQYWQQPA
jgi:hypothetical protein